MTIRTILACSILSFAFPTIHSKPSPKKIAKKEKKAQAQAAKLKYPFPGKLVKNMTDDELITTLAYAKQANDKELAIKTYYHLISQSKSQETLKQYKLDFADYSFQNQDYDKSLMAYEDFGILYPGSIEAEYAQYKSIVCCFMLSLEFDRDQSNTQKTISLCQLFLPKAKDETFIKETQKMYKTCRQRLFDHDIYVFETYMKLHKFKSAKQRLEYIQKEFSDIAHHEEYMTYCEEMLQTFENKKTRPFIIQLNLDNALRKKEDRKKTTSWRYAVPFFLS
ncbi:outer membrane protein assembly factor BamD [Candidatus Babeliales bacterium]|nr:outer membrane protein assembly factor BamD [Candidatus Babeliales bacterium]